MAVELHILAVAMATQEIPARR